MASSNLPISSSASWGKIRPSNWFPKMQEEQSLMKWDDLLSISTPPTTLLTVGLQPLSVILKESEAFFGDLPMQSVLPKQSSKEKTEEEGQEAADSALAADFALAAYVSYAFSQSSTIDGAGQQVQSTRRRYTDSQGNIKAQHDRVVGNNTIRSVWRKSPQDEKGEIKEQCTLDSSDDFERVWKAGPFSTMFPTLKSSDEQEQNEPEQHNAP